MSKAEQTYVLPVTAAAEYVYGGGRRTRVSAFSATLALLALVASAALFAHQAHLLPALVSGQRAHEDLGAFYHSVKVHDDLCVGGTSHSGYVGLRGDSEEAPKRSFFWCAAWPLRTHPV